MNITLYRFSKRENSTKLPPAGISLIGTIKEGTTVLSPIIRFSVGTSPDNNYAYIPAWKRYYYIRDWEWDNGTWVAHMEVDPLASWRSEIGSSTQYVIRSSHQQDGKVIDMLYPTRGTTVIEHEWGGVQWNLNGCYVVGVISGSKTGRYGTVCYHIFAPADFESLASSMYKDVDWLSIPKEEISNSLTKALFNPIQYISSCLWFPFVPELGGLIAGIELGFWKLNARSWEMLYNGVYEDGGYIPIPKHPQTQERGEFVNLSPYTEYTLYAGPFGQIPLDTTCLLNAENIYIQFECDMTTGYAIFRVGLDTDKYHAFIERDGMMGVPVEMAQTSRDYMGMGTSALAAGGAIVSGDFFGGMGAIRSTFQAGTPQLERMGHNGSRSDYHILPRIIAKFKNIVEDDNANRGRPLCRSKRVSSVPGYLLIEDPDISLPATAQENQAIKSYMRSGFFYE